MKLSRFWRKVDKKGDDECWEWKASFRNAGYGAFKIGDKVFDVHRFSWEIENRRPVPDGKIICHTCDNKKCVNPAHLFLGTHKENTQDMLKKGRDNYAKGEKAGASKLNTKQVKEIREKHKKHSLSKLAKEYKVNKRTIIQIIKRETWKHI